MLLARYFTFIPFFLAVTVLAQSLNTTGTSTSLSTTTTLRASTTSSVSLNGTSTRRTNSTSTRGGNETSTTGPGTTPVSTSTGSAPSSSKKGAAMVHAAIPRIFGDEHGIFMGSLMGFVGLLLGLVLV
ncbi:uncharacterized protein EI90DRAFT_3015165 [Cantharellus anzutake]|uniref:uncharacterized protein n=1 Tax=Cantharellus anzutake TaxID=1750568 RepID=UPI0019060E41|nr:uncharacterized protein EI90DRAFT_3015165 [Cantharellus anzutake]KAF8334130.1 hypothetical protein EI90DRAFT_3015165 [Cantharellus anzutake]